MYYKKSMKVAIQNTIQKEYGIGIKSIAKAPRQFVAETFVVTTKENKKLFCKVIDKPLFIPQVIASLPVLQNIHVLGYTKINYPIATQSGDLYVLYDKILIVLFNYIDAKQSYEFDNYQLGKLLAEVHQLTPQITARVPQEDFSFKHKESFADKLQEIITSHSKDALQTRLRVLLRNHREYILGCYANFIKLGEFCKNQDYDMKITHGDAPGNILVKDSQTLYLVDWDDILLAPAERDVWFLRKNRSFMKGYTSIFPHFSISQNLVDYYIYSRYFNDLVEYWAEIIGLFDRDHREENFNSMKQELFQDDGWLYPAVKDLSVSSVL